MFVQVFPLHLTGKPKLTFWPNDFMTLFTNDDLIVSSQPFMEERKILQGGHSQTSLSRTQHIMTLDGRNQRKRVESTQLQAESIQEKVELYMTFILFLALGETIGNYSNV